MFHIGQRKACLTGHRVLCLGCHWKQSRAAIRPRSATAAPSATEAPEDVKPFSHIPGPTGLPYFGTYLSHKLGGIDIYKMPETLKKWYRVYGGVVKETFLGRTIVHVFDPEAIRKVYANEDKWPRIEPLTQTTQMYREKYGMSPGLGNSNDAEWYRLRSAVQQLMMRPSNVEPFLPAVDRVTLDFMEHIWSLRDHSNQVPVFTTQLGIWSLESSGMQCFDVRLGYLSKGGEMEALEILKANSTAFDINTQLSVSLPLHKYIPTPKWKKLCAAEDVLYRTLQKHLTAALEKLKQKSDRGKMGEQDLLFLRYLLSRPELTMSDVAILTLSLFTDGLTATTPQLLFTLYLLATNPRVQDKLYEEVNSVAPRYPSPLTARCLANMPYMKACIKESVRLLPAPNEVNRITKKDMVLGGYRIPAGTTLHLDNLVLFREEEYFSQPDTYMPERWLRDWPGNPPHPFIVLPFSHGPRMCVGRRFAEQGMAVLLTRILQNFRLEWHHPPMGLRFVTLNVPDCPAQYTFLDR